MDCPASQTRLFWEVRADLWTDLASDDGSPYSRRSRLVAELVGQYLPRGTVLDVGCGVGLLACELLRAGYDAYGSDLAGSMVERARARAAGLGYDGEERFRRSSPSRLPFARTFDAITAIGVFPYVRDCGEFLRLLGRHLAPGGILIATSLNRRGLNTWVLLLRHLARLRPGEEWREVWRNLWRTGLWSGGYLDGPLGRQCPDAPSFDRLLAAGGYSPLERIDLYNVLEAWLDARARRRRAVGRWLARRAGWTHLVVARRADGGAL
jgi:SAM-dependent methyltransferase